DDPEGWCTWLALGLALACLVWVWTLRATREGSPSARAGRHRRVRGGASAAFAAVCVAGSAVVVVRMPTPGPSGGVDLSVPLMLPAFALAALGALLTAVGGLRRPGGEDEAVPRRRLRPVVGVGSLAVVPLLTVA